jgi:amino acid adenylation domain-containing protein
VSVQQLLSKLRTLDIQLSVEGDRLHCSVPKGRRSREIELEITEHKAELIRAIRSQRGPSIARRERQAGERLPLSFAQERFWFLQNLEPESAAYNITAVRQLGSTVQATALELALRLLQQRHDILRTVFPEVDGAPRQVVRSESDAKLQVFDFRKLEEHERAATVESAIREFSRGEFDLAEGPLFRVALVRVTEGRELIVLTAHHIICDGWSIAIVFRELLTAFESVLGNRATMMAELPIQYCDYAIWERQQLSSGALGEQLVYWKNKLEASPGSLELPMDRPRSEQPGYRGKLQRFQFSELASQALKQLAREEAATPFMMLLSVFVALLARCSRQQDILIGTPFSTRSAPELEHLIGCFVNTHVLRNQVPAGITTRDLLKNVRTTAIESFSNADIPFEVLVSEFVKKRDLQRSPLFQVAFILQNTPQANEYDVVSGGTALDMTLYMWESQGLCEGSIEYNANLFDEGTIAGFADGLKTLAEGMAVEPDRAIDQLDLVTEQHALRFDSCDGASGSFPDGCTHDWVDRQAAATPHATAVICGTQRLTFEELRVRSNQLAHHLRSLGVGRESLVAICLDRSVEMAIVPLAVWKAGGAYVPLDPEFPAARLRFLLEDSRAAFLVSESRLLARLPSNVPNVVCLDRIQRVLDREKSTATTPLSTADSLAYVLYTSGSTGIPKGVEITQRSLMNFLAAMQGEFGITAEDRLLAVTTFSFDIAALELYLPLVSGATLLIAPRELLVDGRALAKLLHDSAITIMQATPVTWRILLDSGWNATSPLKILCGGEEMPRDLANQLVSRGAEVWNLYGPTETTIWSTVSRVTGGSGRVSIGRPIANTQIRVEDEKGHLVPQGVAGELLIGGEGIARGYLRRDELTAQRFVVRPQHPDKRWYRTGDLVRRLSDGNLEYLGRIDNQIKLRGFRIEPGEIEAAIERLGGISKAAVVVREDVPGDPRLVAYVAAPSLDPSALRRSLAAALPNYMIPAAIVRLAQLPTTPNQKVDRRALLDPAYRPEQAINVDAVTSETRPSARHVTPANYVELVMLQIWREVLGVEQISAGDNFFEAGGNSLSAVRLISRLRSEFSMELPLRSIFTDPTIAGLAGHIAYDPASRGYRYTSEAPQWKCLVPAQPHGNRTPLFFVAGYLNTDDTLMVLSQLIPTLGRDQPVFGFKPRWIDGGTDYTSIEEMVGEFITELRAVQPHGPYLLGGQCVGGIAALEVARRLIHEGEQVKLMILLDTERPTKTRMLRTGMFFVRERVNHVLSVLSELLRTNHETRMDMIRSLVRRKLGIESSPLQEASLFYQAKVRYRRLLYRHEPQKYPGHVAVIVNQEQANFEPDLGWTGFSQSLELHTVPGDHFTMLPKHATEVAHLILKSIAGASGATETKAELEVVETEVSV